MPWEPRQIFQGKIALPILTPERIKGLWPASIIEIRSSITVTRNRYITSFRSKNAPKLYEIIMWPTNNNGQVPRNYPSTYPDHSTISTFQKTSLAIRLLAYLVPEYITHMVGFIPQKYNDQNFKLRVKFLYKRLIMQFNAQCFFSLQRKPGVFEHLHICRLNHMKIDIKR